MATTIADFLIELSEDPQQLEEFQRDRQAVLEQSDLTEQQREVILSGDFEELRDAVHGESDQAGAERPSVTQPSVTEPKPEPPKPVTEPEPEPPGPDT